MLIQAFLKIFSSMSHASKKKFTIKKALKILKIKHKILKHNFDIQLSLFKNKKNHKRPKLKEK